MLVSQTNRYGRLYSLKEPEETEVVEVLKEPFWRYANIFIMPEKDLKKVERIMQDSLAESERSKESGSYPYGSFEVTIARPKAKERIHLNPDQSILVFHDL